MNIVYNRLVELLAPALAASDNKSALLEKLAHILGTNNAVVGSTPEEQLHSVFGQYTQGMGIGGSTVIKIAHLFGKSDAEVFDAVMHDTRVSYEKAEAPTAKPARTKAAKNKEEKPKQQRYGSSSSIAAARGGRRDHKLG